MAYHRKSLDFLSFPPVVPVQTPEIDGLAQMPDFNVRAAIQVGDGTSHLQYPVVGAGGKAETVHRLFQQHLPRLVNPAIFPHHPAAHLRVGEQSGATLESLLLNLARCHYPSTDIRTPLRRLVGSQFLMTHGHDLYVQISTINYIYVRKNFIFLHFN